MKSFETKNTLEFEAIGTKWEIEILNSEIDLKVLEQKIKNHIEQFDKNYSRFRNDSLITKISKQPGIYKLPEDSEMLFNLYFKLYKLSKGLFTPLVGNLLEQAGYGADYTLKPTELKKVLAWEKVLTFSNLTLTTKQPVILDFGAAGKGYLVDLVGQLLEKNGITEFCINAGGDILCKGSKNTEIGLENPDNFEEVIGIASIKNQSICASSSSRRKWANFHHIFNPETLNSPTEILSVWVIAKNAILADGLATCLFLCPANFFENDFEFEYLILKKDFSTTQSKNFPAKLFTN